MYTLYWHYTQKQTVNYWQHIKSELWHDRWLLATLSNHRLTSVRYGSILRSLLGRAVLLMYTEAKGGAICVNRIYITLHWWREKRPSKERVQSSQHVYKKFFWMTIRVRPLWMHDSQLRTLETGSHSAKSLMEEQISPPAPPPPIRFGQYTAPVVAVSAGSSPLISSGTESRSSQLGLLAGEAVFFALR